MGESGQLYKLRRPVGPACEGDAQYLRRLDGVVAECLVEVAHAEEEDGVGMLLLHPLILLHQGRFDYLLGHGCR